MLWGVGCRVCVVVARDRVAVCESLGIQQKCGAVQRRARIEGALIVVSLNSGLESNKEEEEEAWGLGCRVWGVGCGGWG